MEKRFDWNGRHLTVKLANYEYGSCKQHAVLCFDNEDWECSEASGCPYGVLTVNLDDIALEDRDEVIQYLDVNNWPGVEAILEGVDWAKPAGWSVQSGFVVYPAYEFIGLEHM